MQPLYAIAAGAILSVTAITACSSSGGGAATESSLQHAMASVSGAGAAAVDLKFGDLSRQRALGIISSAENSAGGVGRWSRVAGFGLGNLAASRYPLQDLTALNEFAADTAVTIGQPPNTAVHLDGGIDGAAVTKKLTALGAKPRQFGSASGLSFRADNDIDMTSPFTKYGIVNQFNQVVVTGDSLTASPNAPTLEKALGGGGSSLLDTSPYRALSSCLGDVIAAWSVAGTTGQNASIVAVGVRDPGSMSGEDHEVICFAPAPGKAATVEASVRKNLALSSVDPVSRYPLSKFLSGSSIDTPDGLVRATLTVRADQPAGFVIAGLGFGSHRLWDGTCTDAGAVRKGC